MHIIHANLAKGFRGGERQTVLLIKELAANANISRQTLVCQPDSPMRGELSGVPKLRIVAAKHQLMGHHATGKAKIVHAHEAKAVHWAWLHRVLYKSEYIITRRVDTPIKRKPTNLIFYKKAHSCVAISNIIANELTSLTSKHIPIIPSAFTPSSPSLEIAQSLKHQYPGRFIIGHIGAVVDRHKGQRILIEAAELLEKEYPELLFIFFGKGEDESALRKESSHLSNVKWMGFKSNILDYIEAFDLFAFPSRNEGLGSILLDVMNAKVPIIASNTGGIPDIVKHQKTGILVQPDNARAFKEAIVMLYKDEDLANHISENAFLRLKKYSSKSMADSYLNIYLK
ncbi:glycosyltransferase family 4 protein [Vreelandella janggokensis]|uniref:glycosyltransferase family 4 protein n=1 Tax=Vreelandella janggokensis TaxID=370767 RepID=UPI00286450D4|nr:glycosyltransferase family 4 protein [Halomonas janggokensis]MDR5885688.1 glycosyltransferase family 4 protein [Halomonas janggokensis]